jgi:hypothetical protein
VFVRESPPGGGPVPALRTGLAPVTASWIALLAADLPFLRREHIARLLGAATPLGGAVSAGAVLVDAEGREQWLAGVWRAEVLRAALRGYEGRSLRGLLDPLRPVRVGLPVGDDGRAPWFDCDTADDLADAESRSGAGGGGGPGRLGTTAGGRTAPVAPVVRWPDDAAPGTTPTEGTRMNVLAEWTALVCKELGLDQEAVDRDAILDLTRDVAHGVARPAAPLTAYLLGLAQGAGTAPPDARARLTTLARNWGEATAETLGDR